jgi:hypothetical protein
MSLVKSLYQKDLCKYNFLIPNQPFVQNANLKT